MICVTGDIHIPYDVQRLSRKNWPAQDKLTPDDYLLICGDFGGLWDNSRENRYWLDWLADKPYTILYVDGNHENFDALDALPEIDYMGGRAHRIRHNIYHLLRGYVFEIDGRRIFTMGGASSHDVEYRIPGRSWWARELPSEEEYARGLRNLEVCGWTVDHIITHCAPGSVQDRVCYFKEGHFGYAKDALTGYLDEISFRCSFKSWFFGHYHWDGAPWPGFRALYEDIVEL